MAAVGLSLPSSSLSPSPHPLLPSPKLLSPHPPLQFRLIRTFPALGASRRSSSSSPQEIDEVLNESVSSRWNRFDFDAYGDDDDDEEEEEEEEDRSLDLLVKFVENVFRKVSKRARKAVRSVLPVAISTKLVGFAVNGLIILSFLWVLKAFIEVICTLGSVVFVSILLIRGVWSGVIYFQESRTRFINGMDEDHQAWTGAQPVT